MIIFSGDSNLKLAEKIAAHCNVNLGKIKLSRFSSDEMHCQYEQNIRGEDVFIIQSTDKPANDNLMQLLVMADAARRASANRITAVIPYYGYARQDRKDKPRVPISAKLVMDLIQASGINRVLSMDLHAAQIGGFTNLPFDHLTFRPALVKYLKEKGKEIDVVVSPDIGAVQRTAKFAKLMGKEMAITPKERISDVIVKNMGMVGDVNGKRVLIVDDLTETLGTIVECAKTCKKHGSVSVSAAVTHGCFAECSKGNINGYVGKDLEIQEFYYSNSANVTNHSALVNRCMVEVDVSEWFAKAILAIHNNTSVSGLFE